MFRTAGGAFVAATLVVSVLASPALGANRYASPAGSGPEATCPEANPCSITDAVNGGSVTNSDRVLLAGGTYNVGTALMPLAGTSVEAADPGARPRIVGSGIGTINGSSNVTLRNLDVETTNPGDFGFAVQVGADGVISRTSALAFGISARGALFAGAGSQILNSVAFVEDSYASGMLGGSFTVRNSTAIALGDASSAIVADNNWATNPVITVINSIARGGAAGLAAYDSQAAQTATLTASQTNSSGEQAIGADAVLAPGAGMQSDAPLFAAAGAQDFRQLPGSVTIDAGTGDSSGPLDIEGSPRLQGSAMDIGADESSASDSLIVLSSGKLRAGKKLRVKFTCPAADCSVEGVAKLKIGKRKRSAGSATGTASRGGAGKLTFKLGKRTAKKLKKGKHKAKLTVKAAAVDELLFAGKDRRTYRFR